MSVWELQNILTGSLPVKRSVQGKTKPDIYLRAAEYLGTRPEETVVFEDVIHAIRTAKQAGFQVVGIYDETSKDDQEEVRREADWYCRGVGRTYEKDSTYNRRK